MEKTDLLIKDIQDLKNEVSSNFPVQTPQQQKAVLKETRFAFQFTPATTWSNCIEKTQNMLRGSGSGQETAGWFHFHKVATSGHEIYTPPMDMQQVYYQTGMPEMRSSCYPAPDPRTSYTQVPPPAGYPDMRPPSQVVNQRFIQCVNHFAPGSRSLPCLLQPSYYGGCRYEFGGPVQTGSDTMLTRMEPCEISARPQRYPHHDWPGHVRSNQEQQCYRQPWDYEQVCQSFLPRYQEGQSRKGKSANFDCQDQKNKEKGCSASFSYLATEVSREMQGVITAGGHALADLLDFCKFVQSFLFSPSTPTSQRNQLIREIILSFIHVSSAYVHLGSVLLMAEQSGLIQSELDGLRTSFSLWETTATSVVMALRTLIHSLSDIKVPEHKSKIPDPEDQNSFKPESSSFYPNMDSPFFNYNFGENGFRFSNSSSRNNQHRSDYNMNQQYEFKRKYNQTTNSNTQKDNNSPTFNNSNLNSHKNSCLNFKAKSCNQLNVQHASGSSGNLKTSKMCDQHCTSPDSTDSEKCKIPDNQEIKNFCFNLLNPEKKKCKGKMPNDQERLDKASASGSRKNEFKRPISNSSRESKDDTKEKNEECVRNGFKQMSLDPDIPILSTQQSLENSAVNRLSYLTQPKVEEWSFGVLNTGDKRPFQFASNKDKTKVEPKQKSLFSEPASTPSTSDAAEKPMSSDGEGSPTGRFSNPELNKALEEHCEAARIQLKHKMLDILGFLQAPDSLDSSSDQMSELKKSLQESLNRISYLVYTDRYRGVGEMLNAVRSLFHKTRVQHLTNVKAVRLADELESNFLDLFKKEFGCCGILYPQSRET